MKRLMKSYDRVFAGVCGGISEYLNPDIDPLIVRLLWVFFTVFNPFLLVVYLLLAIVMPSSPIIESNKQA